MATFLKRVVSPTKETEDQMDKIKDIIKKTIDDAINTHIGAMTAHITRLEDRIENIEDQLKELKPADALQNNDLCLVAFNMPESILSPNQDVEAIVEELKLDAPITVTAATRIPNQNKTKPPILKFAVKDMGEKKNILRSKRELVKSRKQELKKIRIQGAKSHTDLLNEANTKIRLKELHLEHQYYVSSNGKILKTNSEQANGHGFGRGQQVSHR